MAEGKAGGAAGLFAKQVQKKFSRAQEKVSEGAPLGHHGAPSWVFPEGEFWKGRHRSVAGWDGSFSEEPSRTFEMARG